NMIYSSWVPICGNCDAFDSLAWIEPPEETNGASGKAEMLPLIVGLLEDKEDAGVDIDTTTDSNVVDISPEPEQDTKTETDTEQQKASVG
ncbi:MAG: heme biosynthesis protein HemY, partial [Pseudomonadota bacterium]